jgi:hypothetical protein
MNDRRFCAVPACEMARLLYLQPEREVYSGVYVARCPVIRAQPDYNPFDLTSNAINFLVTPRIALRSHRIGSHPRRGIPGIQNYLNSTGNDAWICS